MITFENDFERTFWCERYAYWESTHYRSERTAADYADQCLKEVRERIAMPKEQLDGLVDFLFPKEKCPYGHVFGVDTKIHGDCDICEIYQHCKDAKDFKNIKPV